MTDNLTKKLKIPLELSQYDDQGLKIDMTQTFSVSIGNPLMAKGSGELRIEIPEEAIEQIKQAFIDDGWVKSNRQVALHVKTHLWTHKGYKELDKTWTPQALVPINVLHIPLDAFDKNYVEVKLLNDGAELMTGQEWYDRFEKEIHRDMPLDEFKQLLKATLTDKMIPEEFYTEAAKKAAGISS